MRRLACLLALTIGACTSTAFAASLNVASWHLWAGSQTLAKGTCTLSGTSATTDTYVDEQSATSSFGGATTLSVGPKTNKRTWAFLRFDLSSCNIPSTGGADSATLRLYVTNAPTRSFTLTLARVLSPWSDTLTWNGAQSLTYAGATDTTPSGTSTGWVSFTVTADVDQFVQGLTTNNGWFVTASGSTQNANKDLIQFASSSAASNQPQLAIDYEK
jgi:hypothetical protein